MLYVHASGCLILQARFRICTCTRVHDTKGYAHCYILHEVCKCEVHHHASRSYRDAVCPCIWVHDTKGELTAIPCIRYTCVRLPTLHQDRILMLYVHARECTILEGSSLLYLV
jgi:hypothetical protein